MPTTFDVDNRSHSPREGPNCSPVTDVLREFPSLGMQVHAGTGQVHEAAPAHLAKFFGLRPREDVGERRDEQALLRLPIRRRQARRAAVLPHRAASDREGPDGAAAHRQ